MNTRQHCDWSSTLSTKSYKLQENEINNGALYYSFLLQCLAELDVNNKMSIQFLQT